MSAKNWVRILAACLLLVVLTATRGQGTFGTGEIFFDNRLPDAGIGSPVYDTDCEIKLRAPSYLWQAYVGFTPETLEPAGQASTFREGGGAGYIPLTIIGIPDAALQRVYAQLRAWEAAAGPSYEAAMASGGKYGFSNTSSVIASGIGATSPAHVPVQSFCLVPEPPTWALGFLGAVGAWLVGRFRAGRTEGAGFN